MSHCPHCPHCAKRAKKSPPDGGLDFAAMSRAWTKAGKPGDWRSWCKVHPIKKGRS